MGKIGWKEQYDTRNASCLFFFYSEKEGASELEKEKENTAKTDNNNRQINNA